jgi:prepilin-type N-terminal cleavage/methylation domain-containing protein
MVKMKARQKGFTLLELTVVLALTAIITMVISTVVIQMFTESERGSSRMTAAQQVQNAGFWFKHDGVMAQTVMLDDPSTGDTEEFITIVWTDWNGSSHRVAYALEDADGGLKKLMRSYSIDGNPPQTIVVADSITAPSISSNWDGTVLTMQITVQVGSQNAARTYQVKPRPIL